MSFNVSGGSNVQSLVSSAADAISSARPAQAIEFATRAIAANPDHDGAHYILGLASLELGQLGGALEHLHRAASLDSSSAEYTVHFARALAQANRLGEALTIANIACALPPAGPMTLDALGGVYMRCGAHERALTVFGKVVAQAPELASGHFNHAVTLTFSGYTAAAEAAMERCLALRPDYWMAYGLRSQLRRQTTHDNHIDQLQHLVAGHPDNAHALTHLHWALGKEFDDVGEFAQAFEHFTLSKSAARDGKVHDNSQDEALVDALIKAFPESAAAPRPRGYQSDEPIFIVGMPRSGTTLAERIISSHPQVFSAGELSNFGLEVARMADTRESAMFSPAVIERAGQMDGYRLGLRYIDSTRPQTANKPRFVDKLPYNFLYLGIIANTLPHARIICLRRHPLDTCLSIFRELFSKDSPYHRFAFDLLDIGRFYIQFERMMAHWRGVFPDRFMEIVYETIVTDQEVASRRLIDYCGLPWNDACLRFEHNPAAVATASTAQVRAPIYTTSMRRWERYREQLSPLEKLLNEAGIATD